MSKKSKFLITCAILIGIGIALYIVGSLSGGNVSGISIGPSGIQIYTFGKPSQEKLSALVEEAEFKLEPYQSMDIDIEYANIEIKESDHYGIAYKTDKRAPVVYEVKDGILNITQSYSKSVGSSEFMSLGFSGTHNEYIYNDQYITVYVPQNIVLDEISVINDFGDIDLSNISASSLSLYDDYGNVGLISTNIPAISLQMNLGDLSLKDIKTDTLTIVNDYGDLDITQLTVDGAADIKMDNGALNMAELSAHSLSVTSAYGSLNGNILSVDDMDLTLDSGNCEIKEVTFNNCSVSSDYGDVTLYLTAPAADYSYDLYTDYGTIEIDHQNMGERYKPISSSITEKQIKINCSSGDIKINGL